MPRMASGLASVARGQCLLERRRPCRHPGPKGPPVASDRPVDQWRQNPITAPASPGSQRRVDAMVWHPCAEAMVCHRRCCARWAAVISGCFVRTLAGHVWIAATDAPQRTNSQLTGGGVRRPGRRGPHDRRRGSQRAPVARSAQAGPVGTGGVRAWTQAVNGESWQPALTALEAGRCQWSRWRPAADATAIQAMAGLVSQWALPPSQEPRTTVRSALVSSFSRRARRASGRGLLA